LIGGELFAGFLELVENRGVLQCAFRIDAATTPSEKESPRRSPFALDALRNDVAERYSIQEQHAAKVKFRRRSFNVAVAHPRHATIKAGDGLNMINHFGKVDDPKPGGVRGWTPKSWRKSEGGDQMSKHEKMQAPRDAVAHFDGLYSNWLRARADCVRAPDDGEGEAVRIQVEARDEAARQLLVTPAHYPDHVWWKWEVLEYLASADAIEGEHINNPVVVALALVKADLIRFGIGKQGA
jgi:hypothetical protein